MSSFSQAQLIPFPSASSWVRVEWDNGTTNSYRMGKEGQYDLRLADTASAIVTPETESEDDASLVEMHLNGSSHPTKLLKNASMKMLKLLTVCVGLYGDQIEKYAIANITSMYRSLLASQTAILALGYDHWNTLGFLRVLAQPKLLTKHLTSTTWMNLHIDIINSTITCDRDVFKKVQSIRLLHATLIHWDDSENERVDGVVDKLFECLGRITLFCPNDLSMLQSSIDVKSRVLLSASNSGTIAEEIIALLRKLHSLSLWNAPINSYISQKLCTTAELFAELTDIATGRESVSRNTNNDNEKACIVATLNTIGGYDPRPRIGQIVENELNEGMISTFTDKGKALVCYSHVDANKCPEKKKLSIATALSCAIVNAFNMNRLPLNEMLLNAMAILIYGPGEWRSKSKAALDISALRMQQIHLSSLNASMVLFKNQLSLRKILRQRCPGISRYSSNESLNEQQDTVSRESAAHSAPIPTKTENLSDEKKGTPEPSRKSSSLTRNQKAPSANVSEDGLDSEVNDNDADEDEEEHNEKIRNSNELLIQNILSRATQTNPLKSIYSYSELSLAALNLTQQLASYLYIENGIQYTGQTLGNGNLSSNSKPQLPPVQPTLIHGVPIYNESVSIEGIICFSPTIDTQIPSTDHR